jgi:hypothetical protein
LQQLEADGEDDGQQKTVFNCKKTAMVMFMKEGKVS